MIFTQPGGKGWGWEEGAQTQYLQEIERNNNNHLSQEEDGGVVYMNNSSAS